MKFQWIVRRHEIFRLNLKYLFKDQKTQTKVGQRSDTGTSFELLTLSTLKEKEEKINKTENCTSE